MNKNLPIISLLALVLVCLIGYFLKTELEIANAYSSKPANGHSWSEIECSSSLCINGSSVGIGTDSPGQKLSVAGIIQSTTGGIMFPDGTVQTTASTGKSASNCTTVSVGMGWISGNETGGTATCPAGYYVTGGGAYSRYVETGMQGYPSSNNSWYCYCIGNTYCAGTCYARCCQ